MRSLFFLVFAAFAFLENASYEEEQLEKSLWNLNQMTKCALKTSAWNYNNYGCWCGAGGSGAPVDNIDRCCRTHDWCYNIALSNRECLSVADEYLHNYHWRCNQRNPECEHNPKNKCEQALCFCDQMIVNCWKQFPIPWRKAPCSKNRKRPRIDAWTEEKVS